MIDKWELEKLLSDETKENIFTALKEEMTALTEDEFDTLLNVDLDNSVIEMIFFLMNRSE